MNHCYLNRGVVFQSYHIDRVEHLCDSVKPLVTFLKIYAHCLHIMYMSMLRLAVVPNVAYVSESPDPEKSYINKTILMKRVF